MIEELQAELERRASADKRAWWENYVKGASFRGTPMREIRSAVGRWLDAHPELSILGVEDLPAFRALLEEEHLGDWSSCDWFCVKVLGRMLARSSERERIADEIIEWTRSGDL